MGDDNIHHLWTLSPSALLRRLGLHSFFSLFTRPTFLNLFQIIVALKRGRRFPSCPYPTDAVAEYRRVKKEGEHRKKKFFNTAKYVMPRMWSTALYRVAESIAEHHHRSPYYTHQAELQRVTQSSVKHIGPITTGDFRPHWHMRITSSKCVL